MSVGSYGELRAHIGHRLSCVAYAPSHEYEGDPANVAIECEDCGEVLLDFDCPDEWELPHRECGHSACGQHFIDTGDTRCLKGR